MRRKLLIFFLLFTLFVLVHSRCIHDHFSLQTPVHYYNDIGQLSNHANMTQHGRILQTLMADSTSVSSSLSNIRIYADYNNIQAGGQTQKNQIKRLVNITSNYFYNIMKVNRLTRLFYPSDSPLQCKWYNNLGSIYTIPTNYVTSGVIGDLGIIVGNQPSNAQNAIAKSTACVQLKSNNRPTWGVMIWNNNLLQFDQVGFQKLVFVAIHQMTHILGFSAAMYDKYPSGNLYRNDSNGKYLTSPLIVQQLNSYFGCNNSYGIVLEDQTAELIPSHIQRKVFGNQYMIATGKKGSFLSRTTVALLNSMGWYNVSFDYAEPSIWGKNRGCSFFNIDNCNSPDFCSNSDFSCDSDATAIGQCNVDPYAGSCKLVNYFTNTICIDENYEIKNLNAYLNTQERGGYNSRCFSSSYRQTGLQPSSLNFRCYVTVCSNSKLFLYILIGQYVLVCSSSNMGNTIPAPSGLDGTLKCPSSFSNYCDIKKTCAYGCNKNGACINGNCLCTGSTSLSSTCLDITLSTNQMDNTAGLINSLFISKGDILILQNSDMRVTKSRLVIDTIDKIVTKALNSGQSIRTSYVQSINTKAQKGTYFDVQFGEIVLCQKKFGCLECNRNGCLNCPLGSNKNQGRCFQSIRQ